MDMSTLPAERHVRTQNIEVPEAHGFRGLLLSPEVPLVDDIMAALEKDVWTIAEAAELARVTTDAVHKWRRRGLLKDAGRDRRGRILVHAADVIRAEKATRERARRTYAVV